MLVIKYFTECNVNNVFCFPGHNSTEDQQTLEDEGIILPMKPGIPMQNRSQILQSQANPSVGMANFSTLHALVPMGHHHHPAMMPYQPNYFGNQSMATPGFVANNFPATNAAPAATEPAGRRKSVIENINPFVGEKNALPADLLSAFPVSNFFFIFSTGSK